ncbi:hypothetical protein BASA81_016244 [Batrachochytrium salamandrivorans]|nr:hypothetical protein BASA81_016244 [Batrachochytrium salamandrivorans]
MSEQHEANNNNDAESLLPPDVATPSNHNNRALAMLLFYIVVWYAASVVCNTSAKRLLFSYAPLPLWVSLFQFAMAVLVLKLYLHVISKSSSSTTTATNLGLSTPNQRQVFTKLAVAYTLGFVFVNSGYLAVTVSLAETLRSAEPLFSVLLAKLMLKDEPISLLTALTLLPIVFGGVLSSAGDASFTLSGLMFVSCSNVMFALRSVYTKQLKLAGYTGNAIQTFYEVSKFGLGMLLIVCLGSEVAFVGMGLPQYTLQYNFPILLADSQQVAWLLISNGLTYAAYNQMSFLVLSMVTVVTHAVGNSCRRIVTILVLETTRRPIR